MLNKLQKISPRQRKIIGIVAGVVVLLLVTVLAIALSVRGKMLTQALVKVEEKLQKDYDIDFNVRNYRFTGLATVTFDHIEVLPRNREQLAEIEKMSVSVRIWPLLFGEVKVGNLELKKAKVTLVKQDSLSNYDFLFKKKDKDSVKVEKDSESNYAALIDG